MISKLLNEDIVKIFPKNLRDDYRNILKNFNDILADWEEKDGINEIRIGHDLDKIILDFLIMLTDYFFRNYNKLDIKFWSEFLSTFPLKFYYGSNGDDFNYIYDDELGDIFLRELNDFEKVVPIKKLTSINKKFKNLINK